MSIFTSEKFNQASRSTESRPQDALPYMANCRPTNVPVEGAVGQKAEQASLGDPYPNPFAHKLMVPIRIPDDFPYQTPQLRFYDTRGNLVYRQALGHSLRKGHQTIELSNLGLEPAAYNLQLLIDGERSDTELVQLRGQ